MSVLYSTSTYLFYTAPAYLAGSVIRSVWKGSNSTTSVGDPADSTRHQASGGDDTLTVKEEWRGGSDEENEAGEEQAEETELRKAMFEAMRDYYSTELGEEEEKERSAAVGELEVEPGESDETPIPEFSNSNSETSSDSSRSQQSPPHPSSPASSSLPSSFPAPFTAPADQTNPSQTIEPIPSTSPDTSTSILDPEPPISEPLTSPPSPSASPDPLSLSTSDMSSSLFRRSQSLSTSLSRLSHRATLCLSTFYSTPSPATATATRALDEEEKEVLVERVLEDERKGVEDEMERFVEEIKGREDRDKREEKKDEEALMGWSWFRQQRDEDYKDFNDVSWTSEKGTNAEEFCLACEGLIRLAEHLAPGLAGLCTSDIVGELKKIRTRTQVERVETLEQIISIERGQRRKIATDAVDWLLLMLKFGSTAYQYNLKSQSKEELCVSFTRAWDEEYQKYFNFLVRPLFKIVIKACPSRQTFYSKLGSPVEMVEKDFGNWLDGVDQVAGRVEKWEKDNKENSKGKKVT